MGRIKTNLIELFIDKAVLAVAVIAALAILFIFVIGSPNAIEYDGKKVTPGKNPFLQKLISDPLPTKFFLFPE